MNPHESTIASFLIGGEEVDIDPMQGFTAHIEADGVRHAAQLTMSVAEFKTLQHMPGGVCVMNWLIVRGLVGSMDES